MYTNNENNIPIEWGGDVIPESYQRLLNIARALDVPLTDTSALPGEWLIHYKGKNVSSENWPSASVNPLPDGLKTFPPYLLETAPFTSELLPVKNSTDWYQSYIQNLDYSYRNFLKNKGYPDEAIQLINTAGDYNEIALVSTLQVMRTQLNNKLNSNKKLFKVKGGNSQLPKAMANILSSKVLLNKKVKTISEEVRNVKVKCTDGSEYTADKLICTIPFSVLRDMELQINFNKTQKTALKHLDYTKNTVAILGVNKKFWEEDELPVSMWTNTQIERIIPVSHINSGETFLKVIINGNGARWSDQFSSAGLSKQITKILHRIRPSTQNSISVLDTFSWGTNEFSRGAYAEFHMGQVQRFIPAMIERTARVFFAGEHTSFDDQGMEGALASSERVVAEIVPNS